MLNQPLSLATCLMLLLTSNVKVHGWLSSPHNGNTLTMLESVICDQVTNCTATQIINPAVALVGSFPNFAQVSNCLLSLATNSPMPLDCLLLKALVDPLQQLIECVLAATAMIIVDGGLNPPDQVVTAACTVSSDCESTLSLVSDVHGHGWLSSPRDKPLAILESVICDQINSCLAHPIIDPTTGIYNEFDYVQVASCVIGVRANSSDPSGCTLLKALVAAYIRLLQCAIASEISREANGGDNVVDPVVTMACPSTPICV